MSPTVADLFSRSRTLDGGLGTLLETTGQDVSGALWSAETLLRRPDAIRAAHLAYFRAGAEVAITSSYQVSFEGLAAAGYSRADTESLLRTSVALARDARAEVDGPRWVAASVGPYGAMLADGSEYHGRYGLAPAELAAWHAPRLEVLADAGADLLALETIPSLAEARVLVAEVDRLGVPAWLSLTAADGRLRSGDSLEEAVVMAAASPNIVAVGVNCCHPREVLAAITAARRAGAPAIVVYANSGEEWHAHTRTWSGSSEFDDDLVASWLDAGADLVGGCCRTGPGDIAKIAAVVSQFGPADAA